MRFFIVFFSMLVTFSSCTSRYIDPETKEYHAITKASSAGWEKQLVQTTVMPLAIFKNRQTQEEDLLTVYIEGDGAVRQTKTRTSSDPTPKNPVALLMAIQHKNGNAVYLARPCQYQTANLPENCTKKYWTYARFSREVIAASQEAIDAMKKEYKAEKIQLIGFSGGGAVATIIASQRTDIDSLVTVAGNLDHATWTRLKKLQPLRESLNPVDYWQGTKDIRQIHFVGENDKVITSEISASFASKFPENNKPEVVEIGGFDHGCCWAQQWPDLMNKANSYLIAP